MLCEHCKKREATVKYVEVINGVKTEHNLCTYCAGKVDMGQYSALFEGEFPLGKLLSGLLGMQDSEPSTKEFANVVCPTCGTTYEKFVKDSQFGCPDCYSVFGPLIGENIKHLQGSERHVGKRPKRTLNAGEAAENNSLIRQISEEEKGLKQSDSSLTAEEKIRILKGRLQEAIGREDFEEAAALRDEIKKWKEETEKDGKMV